MQQRHSKTVFRYSFDSLRELGEYIETAPRTWGNFADSRNTRATQSWDLGLGYDGAVRMAREGWLEGAQRAQEAIRAFTPRNPSPDTRVDFYGHMPHVPRYCAGAPDSMLRHTTPPKLGSGRVVVLYVNTVANAMQRAENMSNYGVAVAQYINQLETEGLRVELHAGVVHEGRSKRSAHTWLLKHADQPLDLAVIAFAIGHPAMFRRLWFALAERSLMPPASSYHRATDLVADDIVDMPPNAYILNGMSSANSHSRTPENALEAVEAEITKAIETLDEGVI